MVTATHELRLAIDATPAKKGAGEFTAAIAAIKRAVGDLERETDGTFTKLAGKKITLKVEGAKAASAEAAQVGAGVDKVTTSAKRAEAQAQRMALSVATALRSSSKEANALGARLNALDDTAGLSRLNRDLATLQQRLKTASTPIEVRAARSGFSDTTAGLSGRASNLKAEAAAETAAAREAQRHEASLEQLKNAYLPLYAESMRYSQALDRIAAAERAGALSAAQATAMRQSAAASMAATNTAAAAASGGVSKYGQAMTNAGFQIQDFAVQVASGQSAAMAFSQQMPQLLGAFGMVGKIALLGSAAGVAVAVFTAMAPVLFKVEGGAKDLEKRIDALSTSVTDYRSSVREASTDTATLRKEFGQGAAAARQMQIAIAELNRLDALDALAKGAKTVQANLAGVGFALDTIKSATANGGEMALGADIATADLAKMGLTLDQAQQIRTAVDALGTSSGPQELATRLGALYTTLSGVKDASGNIPEALRPAVRQIAEARIEALKLAGPLDASLQSARGLASVNMAAGISAAGAEALFLAQQMGIALEAAQAITGADRGGKSRLGYGLGGMADPIPTSTATLAFPSVETIRNPRYGRAVTPYEKPEKEKKSPATQEESAIKRLEKDLYRTGVEAKAAELSIGLLSSGLLETEKAADLYAQAWVLGQGKVSPAITAQIQQIDALTRAHDLLKREQIDGVKSFLDSVPTTVEGYRSIEAAAVQGLQDSLSSAFKGEGLDLSGLANAVRSQMADVMAKKTLKIGMDALGISDSLFDSAPLIAAGNTAANAMGVAISTSGANVARQMAAAVSSAGAGPSGGMPLPIPSAGTPPASAGGGGWISTAMAAANIVASFFSEGGYSDRPAMGSGSVPVSAFAHAPHYKEGTANTSGIPAVLHPNEAVIPLSKGRKIPVDLGGAGQQDGGSNGGGISLSISNTVTVERGRDDDDGDELGAKIGAQLSSVMTARIREVLAEEMAYGGIMRRRGSA